MTHHATAFGSIAGIVAAVPSRVVTNADCPYPQDADEAAKLTGVRERRWVGLREEYRDTDGVSRLRYPGPQSAQDLNTAAAKHLLDRLGWAGADLDLIVYVTQTPTRGVPADVYSIAAELGADCACVQVNWSCAGYVYGLWTAMRLLEPGQRGLLLVGDATSTICEPHDRATEPLFGDAGSATAIIGGYVKQRFILGTDGSGAEKLCANLHGSITIDDDIEGPFLHMDGAAVFNFTLQRVPQLVADVLSFGRPDFLLFHQANLFMLRHLVKKAKLLDQFNPAQIPTNVEQFGNCSSASIPLAICSELAANAISNGRLALLGYGAGWAWAGASIACESVQVCELIET